MNRNENKSTWWDIMLTTGFYSGYSPFAPGTIGAIVATMMWIPAYIICDYAFLQLLTILGIVIFTFLSVPSICRLEKVWGEDPSRIVVDEMVGVWISLLAVPERGHWFYILGAFVLFRLFDIFKPLGVRRMERFTGGWGVMLDDILAGIYGAVGILVVRLVVNSICGL